ncbi:ABC transporter permease [Teredinibacter waterburyi]|uniref:ABC transporter permease n=1 Tax=Teredinibacter waterburyi TaxID=1500538 RepID=UPI00165EFD7E|nr:ABC transporter permease [Teredinibacter waterburyi]
MSDFYLIRKNLTRNKLRLSLNSFAIFIAFLLFGVLASLQAAFDAGVELSSEQRMIVTNKINFTQPMPLAYVNKVRAVEGVASVTHANWFGAYYQDPQKPLVGFAVDAESYLEVYEEFVLAPEQREAWFNNRIGIVVGDQMARTLGWKVGDRLPVSSSIFTQKDGSSVWEMEVMGIFTGNDEQFDTNYFLLHYKYFIETQSFGGDWIGWITIKTTDPALNDEVSKTIDAQFANSPAETKTTSEKQFSKAFVEQFGNIGLMITSIVGAAFFTILFIVGNSMALSVRERTNEIAVLKTIGFQAPRIFKMVLSESILLALLGGCLGLFVANVLVNGAAQAPQLRSMLPNLVLTDMVAFKALGLMLVLGLVTGILPAWRAMKLNTIDALNRR